MPKDNRADTDPQALEASAQAVSPEPRDQLPSYAPEREARDGRFDPVPRIVRRVLAADCRKGDRYPYAVALMLRLWRERLDHHGAALISAKDITPASGTLRSARHHIARMEAAGFVISFDPDSGEVGAAKGGRSSRDTGGKGYAAGRVVNIPALLAHLSDRGATDAQMADLAHHIRSAEFFGDGPGEGATNESKGATNDRSLHPSIYRENSPLAERPSNEQRAIGAEAVQPSSDGMPAQARELQSDGAPSTSSAALPSSGPEEAVNPLVRDKPELDADPQFEGAAPDCHQCQEAEPGEDHSKSQSDVQEVGAKAPTSWETYRRQHSIPGRSIFVLRAMAKRAG